MYGVCSNNPSTATTQIYIAPSIAHLLPRNCFPTKCSDHNPLLMFFQGCLVFGLPYF